MELAPDTLVAGKLKVVRRLGAGGVGAVWEVEHTLTHHRRALKVLHAKFANRPDVVERFLREASAAGRIGSPHIVETFDAGTLESSEPYLLMELLNGESFGDRLRGVRLDVAQVVFVVRQACLGVAAAHEAGIVHRDLKPDNLFITTAGGKPFVKLLDFGVSRFEELAPGDAKLTAEGTTLGTPLYMSPEQISGRVDLDKRADVYALGVILYQAVAGRPPYDASSLAALAVQIHRGQPTPLAQLCPDLPPQFVAVVEKAMHPERDRRYDDARQLRDALAPFEVEVELENTAIPDPALSPTRPSANAPNPTLPSSQPVPRTGQVVVLGLAVVLGAGVIAKLFVHPETGEAAAGTAHLEHFDARPPAPLGAEPPPPAHVDAQPPAPLDSEKPPPAHVDAEPPRPLGDEPPHPAQVDAKPPPGPEPTAAAAKPAANKTRHPKREPDKLIRDQREVFGK